MNRWTTLAALLATAALWGCSPAADLGSPTLSSVVSEAAGDHCPTGGQKILTGTDLNGNGLLEVSEVQQTAYVCNGVPSATCTTLEGSIVIRNSFDWANLVAAGCTRITGTLEIAAEGATNLGAPSPLVQVGRLEVWNVQSLTSLRFPALTTVDDGVNLSALPSLNRLELPALTTVGPGGLTMSDFSALADLDLPALATVEGDLVLWVGASLSRLNLPELTAVGGVLSFYELSLIPTLRAPKLASAGILQVMYCNQLPELDLPALASAGTLIVGSNDRLAQLHLPAVTSLGGFDISWNPALTSVSMPSLLTLHSSRWGHYGMVGYNDLLTSFHMPSLRTLGNLFLGLSSAPSTLDLGALTTVTEELAIGSQGLASLELPSLTTAENLTLFGDSITSIGLPKLASVGERLAIAVAALPGLELPELTSVGGKLGIGSTARRDDPQTPWSEEGTPSILVSVRLPKLASARLGLYLGGHPDLAELSLPALAEAGAFVVGPNQLTTLSLPSLTSVEPATFDQGPPAYPAFASYSSTGELTVTDGGALTSMDLPALTTVVGNLTVRRNPVLASLALPALTQVGPALSIRDNPALSQCQALAIAAGLAPPRPTQVLIDGNDMSVPCP